MTAARRALAAIPLAVLVGCAPAAPSPAVSIPPPSAPATLGAGLEVATPDSNASVSETSRWIARARADAQDAGIRDANALVPLAVHVEEHLALVWFRNYDTGEQVLAQYSDAYEASPVLTGVFAPASMTVGPSEWETSRVTQAIASNGDLQSVVGRPVSILGMSVDACTSGPGACARVRLAGSRLAAPSDGPGLAPLAFVNLRSLEVTLVLPTQQTPETKNSASGRHVTFANAD